MNGEVFVPIKGYEQLYAISNKGRVYSRWKKDFLACSLEKAGYPRVNLSKDNKARVYKVHRLVAEAFIPKVSGKTFINHKDGDKTHNDVSNLEWCTNQENLKHAWENNLIKNPYIKAGEQHPLAKLSETDVKDIRRKYTQGGTSHRKLAEQYKVSSLAIHSVVNRNTWAHI